MPRRPGPDSPSRRECEPREERAAQTANFQGSRGIIDEAQCDGTRPPAIGRAACGPRGNILRRNGDAVSDRGAISPF